jgi:hypothetical protein
MRCAWRTNGVQCEADADRIMPGVDETLCPKHRRDLEAIRHVAIKDMPGLTDRARLHGYNTLGRLPRR